MYMRKFLESNRIFVAVLILLLGMCFFSKFIETQNEKEGMTDDNCNSIWNSGKPEMICTSVNEFGPSTKCSRGPCTASFPFARCNAGNSWDAAQQKCVAGGNYERPPNYVAPVMKTCSEYMKSSSTPFCKNGNKCTDLNAKGGCAKSNFITCPKSGQKFNGNNRSCA